MFPEARKRASAVLSHHCQLTASGVPWDSSSEGEAEGQRKMRIVFLNLVVCAGGLRGKKKERGRAEMTARACQ